MIFPKSAYIRLKRGLSLSSLGPNEARVIFDLVIATGAMAAAWVFYWWSASVVLAPSLVGVPFALVVANALLGMYTRFRNSRPRVKVPLLLAGCGCVALTFGLLSGKPATMVLWVLLAAPPLTLARVLLNLRFSSNARLINVAVRERGPIVVVGGAGYIGCHVVDQLLKRGEQVRILDRFMYSRDSIRTFLPQSNFEVVEGDATDIARLAQAMKGASAVVHLAGLVGDPACDVDPEFTRHTNIITTRMVKEMAQSLGVFRFVFASSCSVYGVSETEVSEGAELKPVSLYAQTKIDSERELLAIARDDFFVTVLRFATVFGHSWRPRFDLVANLFTAQAMTDGKITVTGPDQWRPFVHVRDLARAVATVLAASPYSVQGQVFNVGNRQLNNTILQLAQVVQRVVSSQGYRVEVAVRDSVEDRRNYAVSFEKIRTVLGYDAETMLEEGVLEMVQEFKKGSYKDYRDSVYNNVAVTRSAVADFRDPLQVAHLYAPLAR